MKRAASVIMLLVSGLLLTGCDLPKNLEEFVGWKDKFILDLTPDQIQNYLGAILAVCVAITVAKGLFGLLGKQKIAYFFWAIVQLFTVALIYIFANVANTITLNTLPEAFTLDSTLSSLHVGLSLDPLKAILGIWTFGVIVTIPIIISLAILFEVLLSTMILISSTVWTKTKAVWAIIAAWIGHWIFLIILVISVSIIEKIYPSWDFVGVSNAVNFWFLLIMGIFGFLCYVTIPCFGLMYGPNIGPHKQKAETEEKGTTGKSINIDEIIPIIFQESPPKRTPPQQPPERNPDDEDIIDAEFHEVPTERLGPGQARLPDGKTPPEENSETGGKPPPPDTQPPSSGGNASDQDWVPPENSNHRSSRGKPIKPKSDEPQTPSDPPQKGTDDPASSQVPKSEKIRRTRQVVNDIALITEAGAAIAGAPEVSAVAETVRRTSNVTLGALETREKSKESVATNPDWVPPA